MVITLTAPRIGKDSDEFIRLQGIARERKHTIVLVDREQERLGWFSPLGEWNEATPKALTASLCERLIHKANQEARSRRHRRGLVATVGLLARFERDGGRA